MKLQHAYQGDRTGSAIYFGNSRSYIYLKEQYDWLAGGTSSIELPFLVHRSTLQ